MKRLSLILLLLPLTLLAQNTMVLTGSITNLKTGEALAGANVMVVGTPYGGASSTVGIYRVTYPLGQVPTDSIQISVEYIGFNSVVMKIPVVAGQSTMDFYLVVDAIQLEEIVVGDRWTEPSRAEKARAYHVETINSEEIFNSGASDVLGLLSRFAGIRVAYNGTGMSISMRGNMNKFPGMKYTQPLIVLDDMPFRVSGEEGTIITDLIADIPLSDIEKIEIVRGKEMFWRYGSAAFNGCIMIWTKKSTFAHSSGQGTTGLAGEAGGVDAFDPNLPIGVSLFGGAALPLGDSASNQSGTTGYTSAGFFAMVDAVRVLSQGINVTSSILLTLNGFDEAQMATQFPGVSASAGNFFTTWLMSGAGYQKVISPNTKIYGLGQVGLLFSMVPDMTIREDGEESTIRSEMGTGIAVGYGGGIVINRVNIGIRYYTGSPIHKRVYLGDRLPNDLQVKLPVQLLQLMVGFEL